ncbi:unnamed protein product, partial [Pylaiella littoralis]
HVAHREVDRGRTTGFDQRPGGARHEVEANSSRLCIRVVNSSSEKSSYRLGRTGKSEAGPIAAPAPTRWPMSLRPGPRPSSRARILESAAATVTAQRRGAALGSSKRAWRKMTRSRR